LDLPAKLVSGLLLLALAFVPRGTETESISVCEGIVPSVFVEVVAARPSDRILTSKPPHPRVVVSVPVVVEAYFGIPLSGSVGIDPIRW
jgi:hypothetical protein